MLVGLMFLGTLENFASSSGWERFGWGPVTLILAVLCLFVALRAGRVSRGGALRRPMPSCGAFAPAAYYHDGASDGLLPSWRALTTQEEGEIMEEIVPGLFHWTTFHERLRQEVSSYYYEPSRALTDPRVPAEGLGWFEGKEPRIILLTNRHHYRHSGRFREAFGCPVFCHRAGLHEFAGGSEEVEGFSFGEEVAPEVVALEVGAICPEETALYLREAGGGAMAFADGLVRAHDGSLGFVPDYLLGEDPEAVKRGLGRSLRRLLDERFENLLFAHGRPLVGGGKEALSAFLEEQPD